MRPWFFLVALQLPTEQGLRSMNSTFVVLENIAKLKPVSRWMSFQWRERTLWLLLRCFDVQIGENMMASQRNASFLSIGYILFMDDDSEHKVDESDDGWVRINWERGEWHCVREWWQYCSANYWNVSIFISFLPHPNFAPLSPNITWARGSDSLRIIWYKKG